MRDDYQKKIADKIAARYRNLELRIMEDIVRRIKKTGEITSTADWQINRLKILGYSSEDIENAIKDTLNASYPEMFELYDKIVELEYVRDKDVYEQVNAQYIPYEENEQMQQNVEAIIRQSKGELENITGSLGFYLDYNGRKVLTPLAEVYTRYLDTACYEIVSGAFDYGSVLRRTVTQLTNSGLRKIDYASGRADRVDVAARRAVLTGVAQICGKMSNYNAEKLGAEFFEVDWHSGARPTHAVWQGRVYSREQLYSVCGLGTVTGLLGVNCYHMYFPYFPGISTRNHTDEWLDEQNRKESIPKEFDGKEYTLYEAKQRQRQMEVAMRAQREKVQLLEKGGADPDEVMLMKAKYQGQLNEYARFSRKMGLNEERERIYIDGRGWIATNNKRQNSMFPPQMIQNVSKDIAQYKQYKEVLGDSIGSLAKFGRMKYNDNEKWKFFQLDYERQKDLKDHPELKLPNIENIVISDAKFTKYLFGGENEKGLAKGKAFSDRLGYDLGNWKELQKEISERAGKYPAYYRDNNGYGNRYEQKIIIYGKKGTPANVIVGWMVRQDNTTSMSSTYIKEIKK
ncbi:minor capsid protein [Dorea sp. OM07-5]|uniref:phage minor capsid protein n=1 Tax=Dorea sp. OM07-5 TaxID=2293100 RepID=UPI000E4B6E06|nr:phage minor capsid protein [Dorea sp. OM07-5]RHU94300.1 minor capsid protein [Dorea sp. OM07-5]